MRLHHSLQMLADFRVSHTVWADILFSLQNTVMCKPFATQTLTLGPRIAESPDLDSRSPHSHYLGITVSNEFVFQCCMHPFGRWRPSLGTSHQCITSLFVSLPYSSVLGFLFDSNATMLS